MSLWTAGDTLTAARTDRGALPGLLTTLIPPIGATPIPVDGTDVNTVAQTYYTVGAGKIAIIQRITLWNSDTVSNQAAISIVESGGTPGVQHQMFDDDLLPDESLILEGPWFLEASDFIRGISAAAAGSEVAIRIDGIELTAQPDGLTLKMDDGDTLTTAFATYYTAPATNLTAAIVLAITVCNTDTVSRRVDVAIIPSGGTVDNRKQIFGEAIDPGATIIIAGPFVLESSDFLQAKAAAVSVVAFRLSVAEIASPL